MHNASGKKKRIKRRPTSEKDLVQRNHVIEREWCFLSLTLESRESIPKLRHFLPKLRQTETAQTVAFWDFADHDKEDATSYDCGLGEMGSVPIDA
jgi:hypothetical protein